MGSADQDKNVSFLLKDLDSLRNVNKKVQVHTFLSALWGRAVSKSARMRVEFPPCVVVCMLHRCAVFIGIKVAL